MVTESAPSPTRVDLGALRRRAVQHELLELLVLRHRAVLSGVGGVVLLGLLLTLVAPGILPSTALTGLVVGLLALAVGFGAAVVVHRQDPVLRAPGQARWDGSSVMAWVPSIADEHGVAPAMEVIKARLRSTGRQRLLLIDGGAGARAAGIALGDAAAGAGIRTLLVDLTDTRPQPGMAAVGDGTARLADAVEIAEGRRLARIGAGRRVEDSVKATVATLERPSRDLELAIVVAPDDAASRLTLLRTVDRAVLVVAAGARQRSAVRDRLQQFDAGVAAELLLVGGHLTDAAVPAPEEEPVAAEPTDTGTDPDAPAGPPPGPPPQVAVLGARNGDAAPPTAPPPTAPPPSATPTAGATPSVPPPAVDAGEPADRPTTTDGDPPSSGPTLTGDVELGEPMDVGAAGTAASQSLAATQLLTPSFIDLVEPDEDAEVATAARRGGDGTDTVAPSVPGADRTWQLRPFRADAAAADVAADAPADEVAAGEVAAGEATGHDGDVAPRRWGWLGSADDTADGPDTAVDADTAADGHVGSDDDRTGANGGSSSDAAESRHLDGPGDLVTTATLEILATADRDAER